MCDWGINDYLIFRCQPWKIFRSRTVELIRECVTGALMIIRFSGDNRGKYSIVEPWS